MALGEHLHGCDAAVVTVGHARYSASTSVATSFHRAKRRWLESVAPCSFLSTIHPSNGIMRVGRKRVGEELSGLAIRMLVYMLEA